jgi:hypothetical protein
MMSQQQIMVGLRSSSVAPTVNLTSPRTAASTATDPASAWFNTDGTFELEQDGIQSFVSGEWLTSPDTPTAALYEIRRTQVSGSLGISYTGTMTSGAWYPLTSRRGVTAVSTLGITRSNQSTWEIRLAGGPGTILGTVSLTVTSDP